MQNLHLQFDLHRNFNLDALASVLQEASPMPWLRFKKKQADKAVTGKHNKFVCKTNYKVSRFPVAPSMVTNWILDHCRASANSANVVRQREANGAWGFQIRHYRDSSINDLFNEYKVRFHYF